MDLLREWSEIRIIILTIIVVLFMRFLNGGFAELFHRVGCWVQPSWDHLTVSRFRVREKGEMEASVIEGQQVCSNINTDEE
jgi:hypothetical protein